MSDGAQEFEELFMDQAPALYRTALRMNSGRAADAEDLLQETSMKAYRAFGNFRPGSNFRAWVFRIMTNTMINAVRKQKSAPPRASFGDIEPLLSGSEVEVSPQEIAEALDDEVKAALEKMSPDYRDVLLLNALDDMSYKEIAEVLDIPIGTVMSRLHRGRKLLQSELKEYAKSRNIGGSVSS